ncbi:DUF1593 domain-containing protein [Pseudoduganella sp. UC29_106]|uniref:DUF1593 domain-containing protein n=1 Tax=Pseudoduganella sp. UC29_106 TaxID=3374553 RepID=UPI003757EF8A
MIHSSTAQLRFNCPLPFLARACVAMFAIAAATQTMAGESPAKPQYLETPPNEKPRVVITADPELDDSNSMVRFLLYSSDFRTEGLIYASSQFHWTGDGKGTRLSVPTREYTLFGLKLCPCTSWRWAPGERFIDDAVENYAKAYPNLRVHNHDYPAPEVLKSKIRWGNVQFDGEMEHDTPGSDLIKALLLDNEESPIYLHAWGGQSTIARALKSIEEQYQGSPQWASIRAKVIRKAVIHPSGDQDDTYANYIKPDWPDIRYRLLAGGVPLGYATQSRVGEDDAAYFTVDWTKSNILDRGPLGASYRVWGDGKHMVQNDIFDYFGIAGKSAEELKKEGYIVWTPPRAKGEFLAEGDTPTFLNLLDNGLRGYRGDSFGGWAGTPNNGPTRSFAVLLKAMEANIANPPPPRPIERAPTHPFLAAAQRDFAARLQWATTANFAGANHNPMIALAGPQLIRAKAGQRITLRAKTSDPDGNAVTLKWWRWEEADGYKGAVRLEPLDHGVSFVVPAETKPDDMIQVIAEATDNGSPALTHYEK